MIRELNPRELDLFARLRRFCWEENYPFDLHSLHNPHLSYHKHPMLELVNSSSSINVSAVESSEAYPASCFYKEPPNVLAALAFIVYDSIASDHHSRYVSLDMQVLNVLALIPVLLNILALSVFRRLNKDGKDVQPLQLILVWADLVTLGICALWFLPAHWSTYAALSNYACRHPLLGYFLNWSQVAAATGAFNGHLLLLGVTRDRLKGIQRPLVYKASNHKANVVKLLVGSSVVSLLLGAVSQGDSLVARHEDFPLSTDQSGLMCAFDPLVHARRCAKFNGSMPNFYQTLGATEERLEQCAWPVLFEWGIVAFLIGFALVEVTLVAYGIRLVRAYRLFKRNQVHPVGTPQRFASAQVFTIVVIAQIIIVQLEVMCVTADVIRELWLPWLPVDVFLFCIVAVMLTSNFITNCILSGRFRSTLAQIFKPTFKRPCPCPCEKGDKSLVETTLKF